MTIKRYLVKAKTKSTIGVYCLDEHGGRMLILNGDVEKYCNCYCECTGEVKLTQYGELFFDARSIEQIGERVDELKLLRIWHCLKSDI